MSFSIIGFS